jgi:hypothetical protein
MWPSFDQDETQREVKQLAEFASVDFDIIPKTLTRDLRLAPLQIRQFLHRQRHQQLLLLRAGR